MTLRTIATTLMYANATQALLILFLVRNGRTAHLAGIRWIFRCFATIPLVGLTLNLVGRAEWFPAETFALLRLAIGYTLMNVTLLGFLVWLLRLRKPPTSTPQVPVD